MDILSRDYADEDHVFVFDNATTDLKCADDALSAHKMPKGQSKTWGVTVAIKDVTGKPIMDAKGKQKVMKKPDGSRAWLSCSSRGDMLMHLSSKQNANTSSVQAMEQLAVAVD
ncbi:hypothetical protein AZE42_13305 [Rhizopogon vesiculosus]|uniref:Uncharacterized protein n=1 Tax=Rhizopogon vesiculosus TaxID=180088 RepID=A0A1J8Q8Q4_9AGAM|nr:hypothetical protein AZE42_13305 [Rhizopogon vesiculosus]